MRKQKIQKITKLYTKKEKKKINFGVYSPQSGCYATIPAKNEKK